MGDDEPGFGHDPFEQSGDLVDCLDPVVDEEDLPLSLQFLFDRAADDGFTERDDIGLDRQAVPGGRLDDRHIPQAEQGHVESAGDRRCAHRQDIDPPLELFESLLVGDPKPLFLVDDHQGEFPEGEITGEDAVGADEDVDLPGGQLRHHLFLLLRRAEPGEQIDRHWEGSEPRGESLVVLVGQHRRRGEYRDLFAIHDRLEGGPHRHFRLSVANVSAQEAIHRRRLLHVALGVGDGGCLIGRQLVWESGFKLVLPGRVSTKGVAGDELALRIELEQLFRHVPHRPLGAGFRLLPGNPPEPVKRRSVCLGARVLLDQVETLDGHVELGTFGKGQQHELALGPCRLFGTLPCQPGIDLRRALWPPCIELHQPLELPNAVIDVDHIIAHFQIPEVGEEGPCLGATRLLRPFWCDRFIKEIRFAVEGDGHPRQGESD